MTSFGTVKRWQIATSAIVGVVCAVVLWVKRHEVDWGSFPAYLSGVGIVVAALGLNTWRRQLLGTHEFDLARRVLKSLYSLRDAVASVRHPFMSTAEAGEIPTDDAAPWEAYAYQNRWDRVSEAQQDLSVTLVEAEIVWGELLKADALTLADHVNKLAGTIRKHLRNLRRDGDRDWTREDDAILWFGIDDDPYAAELNRIIREIDTKVRPHLQRT